MTYADIAFAVQALVETTKSNGEYVVITSTN